MPKFKMKIRIQFRKNKKWRYKPMIDKSTSQDFTSGTHFTSGTPLVDQPS